MMRLPLAKDVAREQITAEQRILGSRRTRTRMLFAFLLRQKSN